MSEYVEGASRFQSLRPGEDGFARSRRIDNHVHRAEPPFYQPAQLVGIVLRGVVRPVGSELPSQPKPVLVNVRGNNHFGTEVLSVLYDAQARWAATQHEHLIEGFHRCPRVYDRRAARQL